MSNDIPWYVWLVLVVGVAVILAGCAPQDCRLFNVSNVECKL